MPRDRNPSESDFTALSADASKEPAIPKPSPRRPESDSREMHAEPEPLASSLEFEIVVFTVCPSNRTPTEHQKRIDVVEPAGKCVAPIDAAQESPHIDCFHVDVCPRRGHSCRCT